VYRQPDVQARGTTVGGGADGAATAIAALVGRRWPGADVAAVAHVAGDFSARRYLRATLTGGGAPPSAIVMAYSGTGLPLSSEELAIFAEPPRELPFLDVHRLLTAIGAPVPDIYAIDEPGGLVLLEDGGDVLLWERASAPNADVEGIYRRAIDTLVLLHERGTRHPDRSSIAFAQRFDARLYRWELEHFLEYGVERRLGTALPTASRARFERAFDAFADELAARPTVFSHRDYHSWNILIRDEQPLVIDFQDALLAAPEYDLASLLTDRITPRLVDPAMESRLLDYYWQARGEAAPADARARYVRSALQRALKVIGRIEYVAIEKGKPAPLAFLPAVVSTARRMLDEARLAALADEFDALPWPDAA
jgi:N-acetylmuramate 1-kinase